MSLILCLTSNVCQICNVRTGGSECVPWKPANLPICERRIGEQNSSIEGWLLRFR